MCCGAAGGGREDALEVARLDFEPWQGHRDLAIALEKPASVEDRDSDELAVSVPAEVVPLGRLVEIDSCFRLADVEIEDVPIGVVEDVVELDDNASFVPFVVYGDLHPETRADIPCR